MQDIIARAAQQHMTMEAWFRGPGGSVEYAILRTTLEDAAFRFVTFFPQSGMIQVNDESNKLSVVQCRFIAKLSGLMADEPGPNAPVPTPSPKGWDCIGQGQEIERMAESDS